MNYLAANLKRLALTLTFMVAAFYMHAQPYFDGPIQLRARVREVNTLFNATDATFLGVGFDPDEMTYKMYGADQPNLDGFIWNNNPTGGTCLQANFNPTAAGTSSPDFNHIFFDHTYPFVAAPEFLDIHVDMWEDDSDDVTCTGSRCSFNSSVTCGLVINTSDDFHCITSSQPFKNDLRFRDGNPCEWYDHGQLTMDPGACSNNVYRPRVQTYWRYVKGTACNTTDAIDLYTFASGSQILHSNSNSCYSNNFAGSPGNDVFYTFTTTSPIGLNASLCGNASFNTVLYLLDANCNQITFNNDFCGQVSEISYPLCTPGRYYLVVDGATAGANGPFTLTISEDPTVLVNFTTSKRDITCNGGTDGRAWVNITSGTGPFTYQWAPGGANTDTINNLSAGTYNVTVTDAFGCSSTASVTVNEPAAITATATANDPSCFGVANGSITINATGGTAPLQYSIDNGNIYQNNAIFTGLAAGTYDFIIRDVNGCTGTVTGVTLTNPPPTIVANATVNSVSCNGNGDGSVTFNPTGGVSPYQFSLNGSPYGSGNTFVGLAPGGYNASIRDNIGCIKDTTVIITQPLVLNSIITGVTDVNCNGGADGGFTVQATGGTAPFSYSTDSVTFQASGTFTGLAAGYYTVYVVDANNCTAITSARVIEPTALVAQELFHLDVSCNGLSDGVVVVSGSGGVSPYEYSDDNTTFQSNAAFDNLAGGSYWFYVRDNNGCVDSVQAVVGEPSVVAATSTTTDASCAGSADGSIVVNATGGTAPYSFSIDGGVFQSDSTFSNLAAGTYVITVRDLNFCEGVFSFTVGNTSTITATFSNVVDVLCFGDNTGEFTVQGGGGTAPYDYAVNGGGFTANGTFTTLTAGTYTVTVRDAGGCTLDTSITLTEPTELVVTANVTNATCFNSNDGAIDLTVTGGVTPYTFAWSGGLPVQQNQTGLAGGNYDVTVTDGNNCTEVLSIVVGQSPEIFLSIADVTDVSCNGAGDGAIDLTVMGGTPPFTFAWTGGATNEDPQNLAGGTYTVTVTDDNGCTTTAFATVNEETAITISIAGTGNTCAGGSDGEVTATVSGGVAPYTYALNGGSFQSSPTFGSLLPGSYFIVAKDSAGCEATSATLLIEDGPEITLSYEDIEITQGESGQLVAELDPAGLPIASIVWTPTTGLSCIDCLEPVASPETTTEYTVTVTDTNGCSVTATVTVEVNEDFRVVLPNVFTPDGNGQNDDFRFYSFGAEVTEIRIFNRWGAQVYFNPNQESAAPGWDGNYNGDKAPEGTYVYMINVTYVNGETRQVTGSVTLLR